MLSKKLGVCLMSAIMLSSSVYAAEASAPVVAPLAVEVPKVETAKEAFINKLNAKVKPVIIHEQETVREWRVQDLKYLQTADQKNFEKEIKFLREELESVNADCLVTPTQTKIYGFEQVEWMDTLISAINLRYDILRAEGTPVYDQSVAHIGQMRYGILDKTSKNNPYQSTVQQTANSILDSLLGEEGLTKTLPERADIEDFAEVLYDVFYTYDIPKDLITNLKIYVSPYYLDGFLGFAASNGVVGRDEEIVVAPSINGTTKEQKVGTIFHELGHIFYGDVIGANSGPNDSLIVRELDNYKKYVASVPERVIPKDRDEKEYYLGEAFANNFKNYLEKKNKMVESKDEGYEIFSNTVKLIDQLAKTYKPYTEKTMPMIKVNDRTLLSKTFGDHPYELLDAGKITISSDIVKVKDTDILYSLLQRDPVTNEPIYLVSKKPLKESQTFDLKEGDYAIIIEAKDALLRYNDFSVK